MKFQKGHIPWTTGKPLPEEVRKKISISNTGKSPSLETIKKLKESHKGKKHSLETRQKQSASKKGNIISDLNKKITSDRMKSLSFEERSQMAKRAAITKKERGSMRCFQNGHVPTPEMREKFKLSLKGKKGEKSIAWKDDNISYCGYHRRLYSLKGAPQFCEVCGTTAPDKRYDWANLSGNYQDLSDYKRMCRPCHGQYDKKRKEENHEKFF